MKILRGIVVFILVLGGIYLIGPRVKTPELNNDVVEVPSDINKLKKWINNKENSLGNVRIGNESYIVFNDSTPKKTEYSVVYLHGFTASGKEGDPVHRDIAKKIGANLYVPRLYGHGLKEKEPMLNYNNDDYWKSAKEAISIAKVLGDKVIVLGTSHGGVLSLSLGTDPKIVAICLFAPNIEVFDPLAKLISKPWGLLLARIVRGGKYHYMDNMNPEKKKFWTHKIRLESTLHMQKLLDIKMTEDTYKKIKIPVFMGYYFKNDSMQDKVVSVPAMLKMFDKLGTPKELKVKKAFPDAGDHVITCSLSTQSYDKVTKEVITFLTEKLKIQYVEN